jgi:hypothetical protein
MAPAKTYFFFAAIAVLVCLHILQVGLPPVVAFVGMMALAFSSFRKSAWLTGVYISIMMPTTLLMIGYQLYPNFEINPGRFLAAQDIQSAYLLSNIVLLTSITMFQYAPGVKFDLNFFKNEASENNKTYIYLLCFTSLIANLYYYQGSIIGISYTGEKESILGTNIFEAVYLLLIIIALVEITKFPSASKLLVFGATLSVIVINTFLNGARADILGALIACVIAVLISHDSSNWLGWRVAKRTIKVVAPGTFFLALVVGLVRSEIAQGGVTLDYLRMIYGSEDVFGYVVLALGTWADTTFVGQLILHMADTNEIDWLLGASYLDILASTLPKGIYAERALSLPEILQSTYATGGGAFLPAVFFWNGSIWGVLFLSGLYGFTFRHIERYIHSRFYFGLYLVLCASALRAIIYSEQTLYKYILVYIILFFITSFIRKILSQRI